MQPQTTPENNQSQTTNPQESNQSRAALGIGTQLLQHLIPNAPENTPETDESPAQEQESSEPKDTPKEEPKEDVGAKITEMQLEFTKQMDAMRQEIKDSQKMELEALKNDIKTALQDEDSEENKTK